MQEIFKSVSGELKCMKDIEANLDFDHSVRPTRQPQRPIAFHLKDAVKKELLKRIDQRILEKVDANKCTNSMSRKSSHSSKRSSSLQLPITNASADLTLGVRLTCDSRA